MKLPDKFPPGCRFVPTFGGDWFVEFPNGDWFKLLDDGVTLGALPLMDRGPEGGILFSDNPAGLLASAAENRAWAAPKAA